MLSPQDIALAQQELAQMMKGTPGVKGAQKPKRNFWMDQISTAGGIVGGIAGTAVAPIFGTAAGAAIGSGLGETLENVLDPDSGDWGNVGQEALIGGVLGGGPLKLAKAGIGAVRGGAVAARAGAGAARAGGQQALKTSISGRLEGLSNKALAAQYGVIGKPTIRATRPADTVARLAELGIKKPQDAERIARAITGSEGILSQSVSQAVGGAGLVPTQSVKGILKDAIQRNGLSGLPGEKAIIASVNAQLKTLKNGSTPNGIMAIMKSLEDDAANYLGKGGTAHLATSIDKRKAAVLYEVRDELQKQLYETAGANKNLAGVLTPELREQLVALQPGNPQWAKYIDNDVMKAQDIGALRSAQSPFVRISKIIEEGNDNAFSVGGKMTNNLRGSTVSGMLMDAGVNTVKNPALRVGSDVLRGASRGASLAVKPSSKVGIAARLGIGAPLVSGMINQPAQSEAQGLEDSLMMPEDGSAPLGGFNPTPWLENGTSGPLDPSTMQPVEQQQQSGFNISRENIMNAMLVDIQETGGKNLGTIQMIFEFANGGGTGGADMSQGTKNSLASADNAINTLNQLEGRYNAAGGGGGRIGGTFKNFTGTVGLNNDAKVYNDMANASVTQIAKALAGSGAGTVSDMDAKVIMEALARFNDNPEEARAKFADLRQRLETAKSNSLLYGAGGIEEALIPQGAY